MADDGKVPPLDVEAGLDIVLALPAHRSSNANHASFGKQIADVYLEQLRERHKDDPIASRYLDNLCAAIFSAVRAFSVERDLFATRWDSISEIKKADLERVKRIDGYSPLSDNNLWKKALVVLAASGITIPTAGKVIEHVGAGSVFLQLPIYMAGLVVCSLLVLLAVDWMVFRYKAARLARIEKIYPEEVEKVWRQRSMAQYKVILRNFLLSALIIRETYYPHLHSIGSMKITETYKIPHVPLVVATSLASELTPLEELFPLLDEIVDRHLAFNS